MTHGTKLILIFLVLVMPGCVSDRFTQYRVEEYLQQVAEPRTEQGVFVYPVGVRRQRAGEIIVDIVVEGPKDIAHEVALFISAQALSDPGRLFGVSKNGSTLPLRPIQIRKGVFVQFRLPSEYYHVLHDDTVQVLVEAWTGVAAPVFDIGNTYEVRLNDQTLTYFRKRFPVDVDTQSVRFELIWADVLPRRIDSNRVD
jgi:hypothetical protein